MHNVMAMIYFGSPELFQEPTSQLFQSLVSAFATEAGRPVILRWITRDVRWNVSRASESLTDAFYGRIIVTFI